MPSLLSLRKWKLRRDLHRWTDKPINTKAVLQRAAVSYPGIVFRDHKGQLALTLPATTPGDIERATIKTYIPTDGYVVSRVKRQRRADAPHSPAHTATTWTVDTIDDAEQWLHNHGLNLDTYDTINIEHALQARGDQ